VSAVDIGVGHDDDALIAQVVDIELAAELRTQSKREVSQFLVGHQLVVGGAFDIEDLAAQGKDRLRLTVAGLLGAAAGRVAFDEEEFGAFRALGGTVRQLAGEAEFLGGRLAADFFCLAAARALIRAVDGPG
jgi:hypothetical protein